MFKKIGIILLNFFKSSRKMEIFDLFIVPGILTLVLYLFFNDSIKEFDKFSISFNDMVISITSLLSAFGLAALSILVTSSSENIAIAKKELTKRKDIGKKTMSYYKLLVVRNFFALIIQLIVLIISIVNKFAMQLFVNKIILYSEVYLLLVAIFTQLFVVNSMYFLLVTPKE